MLIRIIIIAHIVLLLSCKEKEQEVIIVAYSTSRNTDYEIYLDDKLIGHPPYSTIAPSCSNSNESIITTSGPHKLRFVHYHAAGLNKEKIVNIPKVGCYSIDTNPNL